jgi:hybrid cluster-associated redox disulfide protein
VEIAAWMKIEEVIRRYPETIPVFSRYGFVCLDCGAAEFDSIERGAIVHGFDLDQVLRELNATVAQRGAGE